VILMNFYNSLTSKGSLNWNLAIDLCGQYGLACDSSNPKRLIQMYAIHFDFSCVFAFFIFTKKLFHQL